MSFLTRNAIRYTLNHIFTVAGVNLTEENLIDFSPNNQLAKVKFGNKSITLNISPIEITQQLLKGVLPLSKIYTADKAHSIPIILQDQFAFANIRGKELIINADIISLSFIMLSRYEETIVKERDNFGRFEFKNSIAKKYDFIDFPIVDEYALILRNYLNIFLPFFKFFDHKYEIIPTHDIDEIYRFIGVKKTIRTILGDIYLKKSILSVLPSVKQLIKTLINKENDPYIEAVYKLLYLSDSLGLKSIFYFMGAVKSKYDCGYSLNSHIGLNLLTAIKKYKMTVGFHGGFYTHDDIGLFQYEKKKVEILINENIIDSRQHYLRINTDNTFRIMSSLGIKYDSTLGYAEREGFRCGTCHEYPIYNFKLDDKLNIIERPMIVMDDTLNGYRGLSTTKAMKSINQLFDRCKFVGGKFTILVHNTTVVRNIPFFKEYCDFLVFNTK